MFLATASYDGVKVKRMRLFETEAEAINYINSEPSLVYFGRVLEVYKDKEPMLVYPVKKGKK